LSDLMWNANVPAGEAKVLLLGWSYKAEVGDPRETPAGPLAETLMSKGITVGAWDPHLEDTMFPEGVEVISDISNAQGYDMAVLVTAHKACLELDWAALAKQMRTPMIYDGRRVLNLDDLNSKGWKAHAVGRPV
jgi:UDPglucose 6-dehydrogenase